MIVLPAVDILGGRCVQLRRGDPEASTVYYEDPAEAARHWAAVGATALHVVDLDAALGRGHNREVVARVVAAVDVPVQVAGGIRSAPAVAAAFDLGADRVVVGTAAVEVPELLEALAQAHPGRVVLAADVRDGAVVVKGWTEDSGLALADLLARAPSRLGGVLVTDVGRDGLLEGPAVDLYRRLVGETDLPVIASGGVRDAGDVAALEDTGVSAVVVGTALYEGSLTLR